MPQCHRFHRGLVPVAARCKPFVKKRVNALAITHRYEFGGAYGTTLAQFVVGDLPFEGRYCKEQVMAGRQLSTARDVDGENCDIAGRAIKSERLTLVSHNHLENMLSPLRPF